MSIAISASARKYPKLPYQTIAEDLLPKRYALSLVFIGERRAQKLNEQYRQKTYVPNVLSFPLTSDTGEIFITPRVAEREAKKFSLTPRGYVGFLFIHAILHLKGYRHGATMERAEKKYLLKYGLR